MTSSNKKCLVLGIGGHAGVLTSIIDSNGEFEIIGLIDKFPEKIGQKIGKYSVIGQQKELDNFLNKGLSTIFIGIGDNKVRGDLFKYLKSIKCNIPALIHKSVMLETDFEIREGQQICIGAILSTGVSIGINTLINSGAIIDHESIIGQHCHISSGVTITGKVEIGDYSFIGAASTVLPSVKVGRNTIVGAGSVVVNNLPDNVVAFGAPAKVRKENNI